MTSTTPKPTDSELAALALLTGYQAEPADGRPVPPLATEAVSPPSIHEEMAATEDIPVSDGMTALLDQADLVTVDEASQHRIWNSPWSKLMFVALALGAGVLILGLVLLGFQSKWRNSQTQATAQAPAKEATQASPSSTVDPTQQQEVGDLKTKEALGRQATALDQSTTATIPTESTASKGVSTSTEKPSSPSSPPPAPSPRYRAPSPSPSPVHSVAPTYTAPARSAAAPKADPYDQWQTASTAGSYGQVIYTANRSAPPATTPSMASASASSDAQPDAAQPDAPPVHPDLSNNEQALYEADAAAILSGVPSQIATITTGTTAAATLVTPVVWAQDLDQDQQPQRFGIQLSQPLLTADGSPALPAGTQMVAQVDTISDSGLVELSVQAVVEPTASGNKLVPVPPGALDIQGQGGNPLMAENYHSNDGRLSDLNTQVGIIGALSKVGELLNRPSNSTTVSSPYISSTSVSNGNTNIIGGLLEGGFGALQDQVTQQDQQEIKAILSRPNVWYVSAGQPLQVFVNSTFQVPTS